MQTHWNGYLGYFIEITFLASDLKMYPVFDSVHLNILVSLKIYLSGFIIEQYAGDSMLSLYDSPACLSINLSAVYQTVSVLMCLSSCLSLSLTPGRSLVAVLIIPYFTMFCSLSQQDTKRDSVLNVSLCICSLSIYPSVSDYRDCRCIHCSSITAPCPARNL